VVRSAWLPAGLGSAEPIAPRRPADGRCAVAAGWTTWSEKDVLRLVELFTLAGGPRRVGPERPACPALSGRRRGGERSEPPLMIVKKVVTARRECHPANPRSPGALARALRGA